MKHLLIYGAAVWFAVSAYGDTVDLYIISGQSNAFESRVEPTDDVHNDLLQPDFGIRYSFYDMFYGNATDWGSLRPRSLSSPTPGQGIGLEMSFGLAMDQARDNPIAIIKAWRGGANLDQDFDPEATDGIMAYPSMMTYITTQIDLLHTQGHTVNIEGFAWVQGESDADGGTAMAGRYGANLAGLIDALRTDLNAPSMPFIYNRLNNGVDYINKPGVRAGQEWVSANVPHVVMLDVDAVPLGPDLHHYGVHSKITLGEMFADAMLFGPLDEDFNSDGLVNVDDLNIIVTHWNRAVPPGATSLGDADGDGFVGRADLMRVVNRVPPPPPTLRFSDFDGDDYVGIDDLQKLLARWNTDIPPGELGTPDVNSDGYIGIEDLTQLLSEWNTTRIEPEVHPPTPEEMDLDGSGGVGQDDLNLMLTLWSFAASTSTTPSSDTSTGSPLGDFNSDGAVDINDLRYLLTVLPADPKLGPADLNADGLIGIDDLTRILANFNSSVLPGHPGFGDVDGDGFVGIDDLNLVLGNWNAGTPQPPPPAPEVSSRVPEPGVVGVMLVGVWGVVCRRG